MWIYRSLPLIGTAAAVPALVALNSFIFCLATGQPEQFVFPWDQWLDVIRDSNVIWFRNICLAGGMLIDVLIVVVLWGFIAQLPRWNKKITNDIVSDNHGTARFGKRGELLRDFAQPENGLGILIGAVEAKTNAPILYSDPGRGPGHSIVIAGPDGMKSVSALNRIYRYHGPRVILDPSNEFAPMLTETLQNQGYNVWSIGSGRDSINVLDWLSLSNPNIDADITTAAGHLFDEKAVAAKADTGSDPVWNTSARMMVNCLLSHMIFSGGGHTTEALRYALGRPDAELLTMLENIGANSPSQMAAFLANRIRGVAKSERTWASVCFTVTAATAWLANPLYARMVSGNSLKTRDVLDPKTVVFIDLPLSVLQATPAIGRAILGSLMNAVLHEDGALAKKVLFELEEGDVLGPMSEIYLMYTTGRKYGAIMQYIVQSDYQLDKTWSRDVADIIRNCCSFVSYNSIQAYGTAERLSKIMGTHGVVATSHGDNRSTNRPWGLHLPNFSKGDVENEHEIKKNLMNADQIMRSPASRMWVTALDCPYVVECATAPFFQYPSVAARMDNSRFNRANRKKVS